MRKLVNLFHLIIPPVPGKIRNYYTADVVTLFLLSNLVSYLVYCLLLFVGDAVTLSAGVSFCMVNLGMFLLLIYINNRQFHSQQEHFSKLLTVKQFNHLTLALAFYQDVKERLLAVDFSYHGVVNATHSQQAGIHILFQAIFSIQGEKIYNQFISRNGNIILFLASLSEIELEALSRYYLDKEG